MCGVRGWGGSLNQTRKSFKGSASQALGPEPQAWGGVAGGGKPYQKLQEVIMVLQARHGALSPKPRVWWGWRGEVDVSP